MATISGVTNERIFSIPRWLGLNEHPDGDTRLKMGEASKMVNWRITRDGNLKRRPGTKFVAGLCADYDVAISDDMTDLGTFASTDTFETCDDVSADRIPGSIQPVNVPITLANGVLGGLDDELEDSICDITDYSWLDVEDGIFTDSSLESPTVEELEAACAELEDGEYYYVIYDEITYAVNSNCFTKTGSTYQVGGYRVRPVPAEGTDSLIEGMWTGMCAGKEVFLVACGGTLWNLWDADTGTFVREAVEYSGEFKTDKGVSFFPFDNKVYILNGYEYYEYDGDTITPVEGYRPLVAIAISPDLGGGSESGTLTGEYVNRLNGKRRVWISPDGTNATFAMPEKNLSAIDWVKDLTTGSTTSAYTANLTAGTVTFNSAPARGVNTYEIGYSVATTYRSQVTSNLFSELYSGTTDTRIFLYGDGTNKTIYSGMDYDGMPRADYYPDQYEVMVGDSNTGITSMIRHYGNLVCYKPSECWNLQHGVVELATGDLTPSIYCTPVNRDKGNVAPGQVRLVNNSPVTCSGTELYHWINSSYYTSSLSRDERQTKRISDRISRSIKELNFADCLMWDDDDHQEFYLVQNKVALVWNYASDAWYRYENFDAVRMCNFHGELYIGSSEGRVLTLTDTEMGDEGVAIQAFWESGAMDFGADYMRKYAATLWVGLKPVEGTSVDVCVETDRKNTFSEKTVSSAKAKISGQPFAVKTKLKAKKFEFYRLILSVKKKMPAVTVTNVDIQVRQTGYAK